MMDEKVGLTSRIPRNYLKRMIMPAAFCGFGSHCHRLFIFKAGLPDWEIQIRSDLKC